MCFWNEEFRPIYRPIFDERFCCPTWAAISWHLGIAESVDHLKSKKQSAVETFFNTEN